MNEDLLARLRVDFPDIRFRKGQRFAFRPPNQVIVGPDEPRADLLLLHELGHALLRHQSFKADIERLKMEMEAWERARELAIKYGIEYDDDLAQKELDTYRNWLHQKSRCPKCGLTRFSTSNGQYHCPKCDVIN